MSRVATHRAWLVPVVCGGFGALVSGFLVHAVRFWPVDDGFIHLRIVEQILTHGTLSFNDTATGLTTTSPLWNLVWAGAASTARIAPGDVLAMKAIAQITGAILIGLSCLGIAVILQRHSSWAAYLAAAMIATDPYLTYSAASMMEMPLYVCAVIWLLVLEERCGPTGKRWLVGAALSCAVQIRPEALTLIAGILAKRFLLDRRGLRSVVLDALVILATTAAWAIGYFADVGEFIPRSLVAKATGSDARDTALLSHSARQVVRYFVQVYLLPAGVGVVAFVIGRNGLRRSSTPLVLFYIWLWLVPLLGYLAFLKEPTVSSRYMCALLPGLVLTIAHVMGGAKRVAPAVTIGLSIVVIGYGATANVAAISKRNARGAALEPERIDVGHWISQNTPADARIYAHALGYIGYYCDRYCIGGAGLVDLSGAGRALRDGHTDWQSFLERESIDYYVSRTDPPVAAVKVYASRATQRSPSLAVWKLTRGEHR